MKKRLFFALFALSCFVSVLEGQDGGIVRQTFLYAVKGTDSLFLDKYDDPSVAGMKPCVIFMFGGGFRTGCRNAEGYVPFYRFLAREGYCVVTPDYRLGMTEVVKMRGLSVGEFERAFVRAQDLATADLFDATRYVLDRAEAWGIDRDGIVSCGSSAGAIAALNGEHQLCNRTPLSASLPDNFDYAGIISFAGAILCEGKELEWARNPCPIQLFHGDADNAVPFDRTAFEEVGYFGSKYLAAQFRKMRTPYCFYAAGNVDHDMAGIPMYDLRNAILDFMARFVKGKRPLMLETGETCADRPEAKRNFTMRDYVAVCFGPVLEPEAEH